MNPMSNYEYLEHEGGKCPYCSSEDLSGDRFDMEGTEVFQKITCNTCNAEWFDIYHLTGYDPYSEPMEDE